MMMGGPQPPMSGPSGIPPNLLPFASTQPGGIEQLAGPLLAQQQLDMQALKRQQLEAVMAVVMQNMAQMPNPAAEAAQVEPSAPLDGAAQGGPGAADRSLGGGPPDPMGQGGY
jgi:hypothetical protein